MAYRWRWPRMDGGTEILCSVVGDGRLDEILHKPDTEGIDEGEQPLAAERLKKKRNRMVAPFSLPWEWIKDGLASLTQSS